MLLLPIGKCQICGCTENNACGTDDVACSWVDDNHDLCTHCLDVEVTWKRVPVNEFLKKIKESER